MGGKKTTCGCFPTKRKRKKKPTDAARTPLHTDQKESLKKKPSPVDEDVTVQTALLPKSSPRESPKLDKASIKEENASVEVKSTPDEVLPVTNKKSISSFSSASSQSGSCNSVIEVPKKSLDETDTTDIKKNENEKISSSVHNEDISKSTETPKEPDALPEARSQEQISKPKTDIITDDSSTIIGDVAKEVDQDPKVDLIAEAKESVVPVAVSQLQSQPDVSGIVQKPALENENSKEQIEETKEGSVLSTEDVKISERASPSSSRSSESSFEIIEDVVNVPSVDNSVDEKDSELERGILAKEGSSGLDVTDGSQMNKTASEELKDFNVQLNLNSSSSSTRTEDFHDASNYSDVYLSSESIPKQSGESKIVSEKTAAADEMIVNEVTVVSTESVLQTTHQELDKISDKNTEQSSPASTKNDSEVFATTDVEDTKHVLADLDKINKSEALTVTHEPQANSDTADIVGENERRHRSSSSSSSEPHESDALDLEKRDDVDNQDEEVDASPGDSVFKSDEINLVVHDELPNQTMKEAINQSDSDVDVPQEDEKKDTHKDLSSQEVKLELPVQENSENVLTTEDSSPKKTVPDDSGKGNNVEKVTNSQTSNETQSFEDSDSAVISKEGDQQSITSDGTSSSSSIISQADHDKANNTKAGEELQTIGIEQTTNQEECSADPPSSPTIQRKKREDITFQSGWRKTVKLIDLLSAGIVTEETVESLESGVLDETVAVKNLNQYLNGTEPVAGLLIKETGEKMSLHDATKKRIVRRGTAVSLLEAQAATGSIISPYTGEKMNVEEATKVGLIDKFLQSVLSRAERAACGFNSKLSSTPLSLFEAMKKNLVIESHGIRLLEAQIATGGIIDPRANHRLPVEVAFERGLFDERLNKVIDNPSDETKGFFDPNTNQNLTYMQLLERCVTDEETSLKLLPIYKGKQKKDYWKQSD